MRSVRVFVIVFSVAGAMTEAARQGPAAFTVRDFSAGVNLDDSTDPTANVSIGDLDGDGDLDLVLAKGRHDGVLDRVLLNDGKGHFTAKDLGTAKDASYSALLADIDGDGDLDVIVSNDSEAKVVYTNDGKANFQLAGEWGTPDWPTRNATVADLNGDGRPDIIAANRSPRAGRRSEFCLNDGRGHFPACTELAVGAATSIVTADFDRDGHIDIAVPNRDGGQSLILYNDGHAGFARTAPFGPNTTAARTAAAGDLNGDGWPDLVVGDERVDAFVHLNDGKGSLQPGLQLKFDRLAAPYSMAIGDLNRDGAADMVIGYAGERGSILFGDGSGRSFRHVRFGDDTAAVYGVALGDLDGDGYPDIVAARSGAPNVVFFNRAGPGVDIIVASDRIASPDRALALLKPEPRAVWNPMLGAWRGLATSGLDYHGDVEVRLSQLDSGQIAGTTILSSNAVAYCRAALTFKERKPDGAMVFSAVGKNGCEWLEQVAQVTRIDDEHLQWASGGATATLERKHGSPNPAIGDLDGDGRPDCPNDSRVGSNRCIEIPAPYSSTLAPADFDRDGDIDLAVPATGVILLNDGHGGFPKTAPGPKNADASAVAAGDLNGDGWPDLVLADQYSGTFVYLNDRRGRLQPARQFARSRPDGAYAMAEVPTAIAIGDLNSDGHQDLVLVNEAGSVVLFGDGTGERFAEVRAGSTEAAAYGLAVRDLNGDGSPDIATAHSAPLTPAASRPGGASTIVVTDKARSAVPYFAPAPRDPANPMLGVWRGTDTSKAEPTTWEILIERLVVGQPAGRLLFGFSNIYYCGYALVLKDVKADGVYSFEGTLDTAGDCGAAWGRVNQLRMLGNDRLEHAGADGKKTTLERKAAGAAR
jgi:hypothetical protein